MTIVLVHGNPETAAIWGPLIDALKTERITDVTTLSPPGFGAPTPDGWDPTPQSYVAWLTEQLRQMAGPIDLVGHDWGAGHVFGLLATEPDLIRSFAADCAGLIHPDYEWHDMAKTWQTEGAGEDAVESMQALSSADRQEMFANLGMPPDIAIELAAAAGKPEMGSCVLGLYRAAAQPAMTELGARLSGASLPPGLILNATADAYVGPHLAPEVAKSLGARRLDLHDQGHWWMVSAPEVAAHGLAEFWGTLP